MATEISGATAHRPRCAEGVPTLCGRGRLPMQASDSTALGIAPRGRFPAVTLESHGDEVALETHGENEVSPVRSIAESRACVLHAGGLAAIHILHLFKKKYLDETR